MSTAYLVFLCGPYYIVNAAGRCYGGAYLGDFVLNAVVQGESCESVILARINEGKCRTEAHFDGVFRAVPRHGADVRCTYPYYPLVVKVVCF